MRKILIPILILVLLAPFAQATPEQSLRVRYPAVQHFYYQARDAYYVRLLETALSRTGRPFVLEAVPLAEYSEERSVRFLLEGHYRVHWLNTTAAREAVLRPVRIPLEKGAIGWRAFFIRPESAAEFAAIDSLEELRAQVLAQGHDWADVDILRGSGLKVERNPSWAGLFQMILKRRADAFPRSIAEIAAEARVDEARGLMIEPTLLLHYPAAYYFFVAPDDIELAKALEQGLRAMQADGTLDAMFFEQYGPAIEALQVGQRRVISIHNPALENQMPLDEPDLWFNPAKVPPPAVE